MAKATSTRKDDLDDRQTDAILGCLLGGAIGDAAGASSEGASSTTTSWLAEDWHLTDDTQLTLATCEALLQSKAPDPALIAASMLRWFRARRLTGLGASTLKALRDLDMGAHWALAGRKGDRGAGNGAAMRSAPLAFCVDPRQEEARRLIRDVCRITHHNDEAYVGALAVVLAIWEARSASQNVGQASSLSHFGQAGSLSYGGCARHSEKYYRSLEMIISHLPDTSVRDRLLAYATAAPECSLAALAQLHGSSGYVAESVPLALFAAWRVDELGFAEMLSQVIAAGGDTDTNASIAGQVAGTRLGLGGLPTELVNRVPQLDMVMEIAQAFAEQVVSGQP